MDYRSKGQSENVNGPLETKRKCRRERCKREKPERAGEEVLLCRRGPELLEERTLLPTQWTGTPCDLMLGVHRVLKHNRGPQVSSARLVHGVEEEISTTEEYDRRMEKGMQGEQKRGKKRGTELGRVLWKGPLGLCLGVRVMAHGGMGSVAPPHTHPCHM